ncbi:MAG: hypothetical protein HC801_13915 [Nitrospira sp.]|nr:hypothetical protein [Nitrospira sp.]
MREAREIYERLGAGQLLERIEVNDYERFSPEFAEGHPRTIEAGSE